MGTLFRLSHNQSRLNRLSFDSGPALKYDVIEISAHVPSKVDRNAGELMPIPSRLLFLSISFLGLQPIREWVDTGPVAGGTRD